MTDAQFAVPALETLFYRLAMVNARLQEMNVEEVTLLQERREIMELITRARLGSATSPLVMNQGREYMA